MQSSTAPASDSAASQIPRTVWSLVTDAESRPDLCTDTTTTPPPLRTLQRHSCSLSPSAKRSESAQLLPPASSWQAQVKLGVISQAQLVPHLSNLPSPLTHFKTPPPLPRPLPLSPTSPFPAFCAVCSQRPSETPDKKRTPRESQKNPVSLETSPTCRGGKRRGRGGERGGVVTADLLDGGRGRRGNPVTCGRLGARCPSPLMCFDKRDG